MTRWNNSRPFQQRKEFTKNVGSKTRKRIRHSWRTVRFSGLTPCEHTTAGQLFQTTPASPPLRVPSLNPAVKTACDLKRVAHFCFPHRPTGHRDKSPAENVLFGRSGSGRVFQGYMA
ncbi:MAG: hypothetical protein CMJ81_11730 [Planctomycetaceae bacterium]|nr:hypothetical protein [Planctomycetaceae bacterium]MBP63977.1 hypothetical protein [Planctomycetaceae bacterium]